jgi:hypothetical protein
MQEEIFPANQPLRTSSAQIILHMSAALNGDTRYPGEAAKNYSSSCFLFKTRRFGDWILSPSSSGTYSVEPKI